MCVRVRACVCVQVNSSVHMCNMYPIWRVFGVYYHDVVCITDCCRFYTSEMVVAIDSIHKLGYVHRYGTLPPYSMCIIVTSSVLFNSCCGVHVYV